MLLTSSTTDTKIQGHVVNHTTALRYTTHLDLFPDVLLDLLKLLGLRKAIVYEEVLDELDGVASRAHGRDLVTVTVCRPRV